MIYYILAALALIPAVLLLSRPSGVIYIKKLLLPVMCIIFTLCLVLFPGTAVKAASNGVSLWLNIVLPSLLPFFIASELLRSSGFVKAAGVFLEPVMRPLFNIPGCGSFPFLIGITSGYPVGAKFTVDLKNDGLLTRNEAERLLAFSNNSGPLFIVGAVAAGMFKMPELGLFLLACHIAAGITVGIIFKYFSKNENRITQTNKKNPHMLARFKKELLNSKTSCAPGFGTMLGDAVRNSISTLLAVGGFIIFFSVFIAVLTHLGIITLIADIFHFPLGFTGIDKEMLRAVISGFFEITAGSNLVSGIKNASLLQQLMSVSFIIGWAGLSVHSQVISIVSDTGLSIKPYIFGKLLQGTFASIYAFIAYNITGGRLFNAQAVFYNLDSMASSRSGPVFISSLLLLSAVLLLFMLLSGTAYLINGFRRHQSLQDGSK